MLLSPWACPGSASEGASLGWHSVLATMTMIWLWFHTSCCSSRVCLLFSSIAKTKWMGWIPKDYFYWQIESISQINDEKRPHDFWTKYWNLWPWQYLSRLGIMTKVFNTPLWSLFGDILSSHIVVYDWQVFDQNMSKGQLI